MALPLAPTARNAPDREAGDVEGPEIHDEDGSETFSEVHAHLDEAQLAYCQAKLTEARDAALWAQAEAGSPELAAKVFQLMKQDQQPRWHYDVQVPGPYQGSLRRRTIRIALQEAARRRSDRGRENREPLREVQVEGDHGLVQDPVPDPFSAWLSTLGDVAHLVDEATLRVLFAQAEEDAS